MLTALSATTQNSTCKTDPLCLPSNQLCTNKWFHSSVGLLKSKIWVSVVLPPTQTAREVTTGERVVEHCW